MAIQSEDDFKGDLSDFEQQIARANAALEAMPAPNPATSRQVIIATREGIKRQIRTHGAEAVWQIYVTLGHKVKFSTFRDYVYNGGASREAKGAAMARKVRQTRKASAAPIEVAASAAPIEAAEEPINRTESSARGGPVIGRKVK